MNTEQIKDRMVRTAARLWNIPEHEIGSEFDPLVMLLIEACAAEMGKLSSSMVSSQTRLMDQLASLLVPEAMTGVRPASCVLSATPAETRTVMGERTAFVATGGGSAGERSLFFTPVGDFLLHNARLVYTVIGKKVYNVKENGMRELFHTAGENTTKLNEILLVLEPHVSVTTLKGLNIHFQFRNNPRSDAFYANLSHTSAWLDDRQIGLAPGYSDQQQFELEPATMLSSGYDISKVTLRRIAAHYAPGFLHITDDAPILPGRHPKEVEALLSRQQLQKMNAERWVCLKLKFDRYYEPDDLAALVTSINAFPVINRKFNTRHYRTDSWVNILPLPSDGHFLDLESITASNGNPYIFRMAANEHPLYEGEATVRSAGIGKPGAAEVRNSISALVDSIRNESAFFSELTNDFILSRLKEMNQILARLEDQLAKTSDKRTDHHYVLLKPRRTGDTVTVNYWTTDGLLPNQLPVGKFMSAHNHALINSRDAYTVTSVMGGKAAAGDAEKKILLQQQLLSRGKIVSAGDVRLLCRGIFGTNLQQVHIGKGVRADGGVREGFCRTIDIKLRFSDRRSAELEYQLAELRQVLEEKGTMVYPFRVLIE